MSHSWVKRYCVARSRVPCACRRGCARRRGAHAGAVGAVCRNCARCGWRWFPANRSTPSVAATATTSHRPAARLKPLGRAFFARLDERMAAADRIVKGQRPWQCLGCAGPGGRQSSQLAAPCCRRRCCHEVRADGPGSHGHIRRHIRSSAHGPTCARHSSCARRCGWPKCAFWPTGNPPHREHTQATAEMRLALVRAAVADEPGFSVDDRETRRSGLSYSVDTLAELRAEFPHRSICLMLGHGCLPWACPTGTAGARSSNLAMWWWRTGQMEGADTGAAGRGHWSITARLGARTCTTPRPVASSCMR